MIHDRDTLVLYTTATCNLNCRYCYIDKNKALAEIDGILDESFKGGYYESFIKEMFPDSLQLRKLETWGGEPFLRMDRLHETLKRIIPVYPNLKTLFSSTNMSFDGWTDQFFGLMDVLGEFKDRQFEYCLQVSLDGPKEFTDETRGEGVTDALMSQFNKMLLMLGDNLPENVCLNINFKPTLDTLTLRKLNSKDAIINYYKIFDKLIDDVRALNYSNVIISPAIPNMGCPCMATKEDGEYFAEVCKMAREIEAEIERGSGFFKHYREITPFSAGAKGDVRFTMKYPNYTCGTGYTVLGLLPFDMVSTCHNGFVDLIGKYKELATANNGTSTIDARLFIKTHESRLVFHKSEYEKYEALMSRFNCSDTSARVASIAAQIVTLSHAGQVLPLYKNDAEAIKAAIFYQSHTAFCVRDNYATTGSLTTIHNGLLKLLFNGAHRLLERDGDVTWVN